jgi:DNA-directed RNA polymerase specialized sigma24 family protein
MDRELLERYLTRRDEAAFAALVDRHGPMVLGVCRLVLGDVHGVEDAFQATFLLLARNAGRIRKPEALGSWLYGTAYRVAARARANLARRHAQERPVAEVKAVDSGAGDDSGWPELRALLHAEVNRLPETFRASIVLCAYHGASGIEPSLVAPDVKQKSHQCPVFVLDTFCWASRATLMPWASSWAGPLPQKCVK